MLLHLLFWGLDGNLYTPPFLFRFDAPRILCWGSEPPSSTLLFHFFFYLFFSFPTDWPTQNLEMHLRKKKKGMALCQFRLKKILLNYKPPLWSLLKTWESTLSHEFGYGYKRENKRNTICNHKMNGIISGKTLFSSVGNLVANVFGSSYVSGKLSTYPSPNLTLTLLALGKMSCLGRDRWAVSQKHTLIHAFYTKFFNLALISNVHGVLTYNYSKHVIIC